MGRISNITLLNPGGGYTSAPNVIFTRDTNLIRTQRNRTSLVSSFFNMTALIRDAAPVDTTLYVETTNAFPGSGKFQIGREIIRYTGKTPISFTGCDRGINFRYDQRVIAWIIWQLILILASLVTLSLSQTVLEEYKRISPTRLLLFMTGVLTLRNYSLHLKLMNWHSLTVVDLTRRLLLFSSLQVLLHLLVQVSIRTFCWKIPEGSIITFTDPIGTLEGFVFEDDDEVDGAGDGIIDLVNTDTDFEDEINLDGGIASSLYGIEETVGGQNTTLFQQGDQIYDSNLVPLTATINTAGALGDGVDHTSTTSVKYRPGMILHIKLVKLLLLAAQVLRQRLFRLIRPLMLSDIGS